MTYKPLAAGLCAAAVALTAGSSALAQAASPPPRPAPPPARPPVHGPPIAGMCIISVENAIGASTVGSYVETRMQQIVAQTNAELTGEKNAIDADAKSLDARRATLDQSTLEQQASALQVRANALQRKAQLRDREVQATEQKAVARVGQEMSPLIRQVYQPRPARCCCSAPPCHRQPGDGHHPAGGRRRSTRKITQFAFDRERLDQPQAPRAGGAPPIVQTPGPTPRPAAAQALGASRRRGSPHASHARSALLRRPRPCHALRTGGLDGRRTRRSRLAARADPRRLDPRRRRPRHRHLRQRPQARGPGRRDQGGRLLCHRRTRGGPTGRVRRLDDRSRRNWATRSPPRACTGPDRDSGTRACIRPPRSSRRCRWGPAW